MILFPAVKQVRTNPQFLAHFRRAQTIKDHQPHRLFLELGAVTLPSHSSILQLRESHVHFSQATSRACFRSISSWPTVGGGVSTAFEPPPKVRARQPDITKEAAKRRDPEKMRVIMVVII